MSQNSNDREPKDKEKQDTTEEDLDFQLDDFDEEIIDLIDPLEDEGAQSDDSSTHEETLDEDRDLSFEDFDVEMELEEDGLSLDSSKEPYEDEEAGKTDSSSSNEIATGFGEAFEEGDETSKVAGGEKDEEVTQEDLVTDEALAELFASHEDEVAKLLEEATVSPVEDEKVPSAEPASLSEKKIDQDPFADLEIEAEGVSEEGETPEPVSVSEEELPEDLFADLDTEAEGVSEEGDAPEPVSV
jgi:hypothetical protein